MRVAKWKHLGTLPRWVGQLSEDLTLSWFGWAGCRLGIGGARAQSFLGVLRSGGSNKLTLTGKRLETTQRASGKPLALSEQSSCVWHEPPTTTGEHREVVTSALKRLPGTGEEGGPGEAVGGGL